MWLNMAADMLTKDPLSSTRYLTQKTLLPPLQFRITIEQLLQGGMAPGAIDWTLRGSPVTTFLREIEQLRATEYLSRRGKISQYPSDYWSKSCISLLGSVLAKLASGRMADTRVAYLRLIWDQIPHGRKKAQFNPNTQNVCPL